MAAVTAAVIGIVGSGVSAVQSFQAASDAKEASSQADTAAAEAMADAKRRAEKDAYSGLAIPLDAYEAQFENNLQTQTQSVEALQEGDARGLAAGVGAIGAEATNAAEGTRIEMGEEISDLNMMKAESKDSINQQLIEMDVANAREQNQRRADADAFRAQSINSGINSVTSGLQSAADLVPLYKNDKDFQEESTIFYNKDGTPAKLMSERETKSDFKFFDEDQRRRGVGKYKTV